MALVYAASLPHSPLFVPSLGKEQHDSLRATLEAIDHVAKELAQARPDALLLVSPHDTHQDVSGMILNIRPTYSLEYETFGDFGTRTPVIGSLPLANAVKRTFDTSRDEFPLATISDETLDYGCTTLLPSILADNPRLPVVALGFHVAKFGSEYDFGQALRSTLLEYNGRIAVIASANLSHRLSPESPAGFSPRAKGFDRRILEAIRHREPDRLLRVRAETMKEVEVCGLGPILFLFGLLSTSHFTPEVMSYEAPFGIGFPVCVFRL